MEVSGVFLLFVKSLSGRSTTKAEESKAYALL